MTRKTSYNCNVCGEPIETGHDKLYMGTITISGREYKHDDGGDDFSKEFHVHNGISNRCLEKILSLLKK